jgi:hypothetical protein
LSLPQAASATVRTAADTESLAYCVTRMGTRLR